MHVKRRLCSIFFACACGYGLIYLGDLCGRMAYTKSFGAHLGFVVLSFWLAAVFGGSGFGLLMAWLRRDVAQWEALAVAAASSLCFSVVLGVSTTPFWFYGPSPWAWYADAPTIGGLISARTLLLLTWAPLAGECADVLVDLRYGRRVPWPPKS